MLSALRAFRADTAADANLWRLFNQFCGSARIWPSKTQRNAALWECSVSGGFTAREHRIGKSLLFQALPVCRFYRMPAGDSINRVAGRRLPAAVSSLISGGLVFRCRPSGRHRFYLHVAATAPDWPPCPAPSVSPASSGISPGRPWQPRRRSPLPSFRAPRPLPAGHIR